MVRRALIYQCWTGPMRSGVEASVANMRAYAERIGAEHRFDRDPKIAGKLCDVPAYFEWLNPTLDREFLKYQRVLVVDCDVFAVDGLTENIFDVPIGEVGICTEPFQPEYRAKLTGHISAKWDEAWAREVKRLYGADMPRDELGRLKVYNAGVVMFSTLGLIKAGTESMFVPFQQYIDAMRSAGLPRFYCVDQNYFHAMMVKNLAYTELDNGWNSYIHYVGDGNPRPVNDSRMPGTKFVHVQLRGADDFDAETLWRITNRPQSEWRI